MLMLCNEIKGTETEYCIGCNTAVGTKSIDMAWLVWFARRACLAWQTTLRQSRRLCAEDCLRRHASCSHMPLNACVCAYLAWPNNASRWWNPNQVLMWCSIWFVKVLWDQAVCCYASSWMQFVGVNKDGGGGGAEPEPTAVPSTYM